MEGGIGVVLGGWYWGDWGGGGIGVVFGVILGWG